MTPSSPGTQGANIDWGAVTALALFGSRARGDAVESSDVDLLLWTTDVYPRHVRIGQLSFAMYPEPDLMEKARRGDLFAAHLAHEAVALNDPAGKLDALRRAWSPPDSYRPQVAAASDLAWFLIDHAASLGPALLNARTAWCARTVAIARSAEAGRLAFATDALGAALRSGVLLELVGLKDRGKRVDGSMRTLEHFVRAHALPRPLSGRKASLCGYKRLFDRTGNGFALKTLRLADLRNPTGSYL